MVAKFDHSDASFDVPKHAGHVTGTGNNLTVTDEAAAAKVSRVGAQLPRTLSSRSIFVVQAVDGTDIVEASTRNEVPGRRIGAGHDPTGSQRDGVNFVGSVSIPDDEFTILRGGYEMSPICSPVHSINLRKMAPEGAPGAHHNARESIDFSSHGTHCKTT